MDKTATVEKVERAARQKLDDLGLGDELRVSVLNAQQRSLRDGGFLVNIDVRGVSQFYTAIDWHDDLGIPTSDKRRESGRLSPGRKCLVANANTFRSLEARVRANLERYSFTVAVFGEYRYVPDSAFLTWYDKHKEIVAEFDEEKARLIDNYDTMVEEMSEAFRAMARETWLTLLSRKDPETKAWISKSTILKFSDEVVERAVSKMPTAEQIDERLRIVLNPLATFLLTDEQAEIELSAERQRDEAEKLRFERDAFARSERAWAETQEAKAKVEKAEAEAKVMRAKIETDEEARRAKIKTEAIKAAQLEIARQAIKDMQNPFEEVVNSLRAQVLTTVTEVLANIREHGRVLGKTKEKIENLISLFRVMHNPAVTPDADLEASINQLSSALNTEGTDTRRDTAAIRRALLQVKDVAGQIATDLAATTRASKGAWEDVEL